MILKNAKLAALCIAGSLVVAGCSSTGLDANSKFKCRLGDTADAGCRSISDVYNGVNGLGGASADMTGPQANGGGMRKTPYTGMPIRTPEQVIRVWIAPWEDKDGDLRDQSFVYLTLNSSRWQIAHNQEAIINDFRPEIRLLGSDNKEVARKANDGEMPTMGLTDRRSDPAPASMNGGSLAERPNIVPPPVLP